MEMSPFTAAVLTSAWDVCGHPVGESWAEQSCSARPRDQQAHRADLWAAYPEDVGIEGSQACSGVPVFSLTRPAEDFTGCTAATSEFFVGAQVIL